MAMQEETIKVVNPLRDYMEHKGWKVKKIHGGAFQSGLPDLYAGHNRFSPRWIECKITGRSFTSSQLKEFPEWLLCGVNIWVIEGNDFRGTKGKDELHRAYQKLFKPANCAYYLHSSNRKLKI